MAGTRLRAANSFRQRRTRRALSHLCTTTINTPHTLWLSSMRLRSHTIQATCISSVSQLGRSTVIIINNSNSSSQCSSVEAAEGRVAVQLGATAAAAGPAGVTKSMRTLRWTCAA